MASRSRRVLRRGRSSRARVARSRLGLRCARRLSPKGAILRPAREGPIWGGVQIQVPSLSNTERSGRSFPSASATEGRAADVHFLGVVGYVDELGLLEACRQFLRTCRRCVVGVPGSEGRHFLRTYRQSGQIVISQQESRPPKMTPFYRLFAKTSLHCALLAKKPVKRPIFGVIFGFADPLAIFSRKVKTGKPVKQFPRKLRMNRTKSAKFTELNRGILKICAKRKNLMPVGGRPFLGSFLAQNLTPKAGAAPSDTKT